MKKSKPNTARGLKEYGQILELNHQDITLLRSFGAGSRHLLKTKCGVAIADERWARIKISGYSLAAFLLKDFSWELACLIEDQSDVTKMLIELSAQPEIEKTLTETELMLLKMYVVVFVNREERYDNTVSYCPTLSNIGHKELMLQHNFDKVH